jgi:endonuclease/exonuclease/phosphatase family metal-dependent hydrolase
VLTPPSAAERAHWLDHLGDARLHDELLGELPCLQVVEQSPGAHTADLSGWVRVAAWNVQRGRQPAKLAALLRQCGADVCLLSELDAGMARTHNDHVVEAMATELGAGYAFGVEFVELGLGDEPEQQEAAGTDNRWGLHGNAVVSPARLDDPIAVRLPDVGLGWFAAGCPQPRIGGRVAVVATILVDAVPVQLASTHLENRTDAEHRARQFEAILSALDARAPGGPAVVGGDFNTLGAAFEDLFHRERQRAMRVAEPTRFTWPVAHEPLFDVAADYGFSWVDANLAAPTTQHDAAGLPDHVPIKIDWLLVRGLEARRPAVVTVGPLSDHCLIAASVRLPR